MQINTNPEMNVGALHFELINHVTIIKSKIEFLTDDDYVDNYKIDDIIYHAMKLVIDLKSFRVTLSNYRSENCETAEWQEAMRWGQMI